MALLDRDGVYGSPRFHLAADKISLQAHVGAEITASAGWRYAVLVESRAGYQNLCRLITQMKLHAQKGEGRIGAEEFAGRTAGLDLPDRRRRRPAGACARPRRGGASDADASCNFAVSSDVKMCTWNCSGISAAKKRPAIRRRWRSRANCVCRCWPPMASAMRSPHQREVLDVFTCIRHHRNLTTAGRLLARNSERHLKSPAEMERLFSDLPEAIANTAGSFLAAEIHLEGFGLSVPEISGRRTANRKCISCASAPARA